MKVSKKSIYLHLLVLLFTMNLIAGGVLPLGQESSKDLIKISLLIINTVSILFLGIKTKYFKIVFLYFTATMMLLITSFLRTEEILYAVEKIDAILFSVPFSVLIFVGLYDRVKISIILSMIVKIGFTILILTIFYKLLFGFWDRNVRFFLNGANVFGWLMGFYFLSSVYLFKIYNSKFYVFLSLLFLMSVFWSESKGALLSSAFCFFIVLIFQIKSIKIKSISLVLITAFLIFNEYIQGYIQGYFPNSRLLAVFRIFNGSLQASDQGSIGERSILLKEAAKLFMENPIFGIGLGNFKFLSVSDFNYPHNAHIEIFTENGIIVGFLYIIFISYGLIISKGFFKVVVLYFLIVCTFSGDLGYLRFAFVFILSSICINNNIKKKPLMYI